MAIVIVLKKFKLETPEETPEESIFLCFDEKVWIFFILILFIISN